MKTVIVLAMHGAPPKDFPPHEMAEFFGLHARLERTTEAEREALQRRHDELEAKMRAWPRTADNDPFHAASHELARHLARSAGYDVLIGFNEFCAPSLDQALDQAVARGAQKIIVTTPMMTRGGGHAQVDIPAAIQRAGERHPDVSILYAWPFDTTEVASFLAVQIARHAP